MRTIHEILIAANIEPLLAFELESAMTEKILAENNFLSLEWAKDKVLPMQEKLREQGVSLLVLIERSDLKFEAMQTESRIRFEAGEKHLENLRLEMNARFDTTQKEMNARFEAADAKFEALQREMHEGFTIFRWALGALMTVELMILALIFQKIWN